MVKNFYYYLEKVRRGEVYGEDVLGVNFEKGSVKFTTAGFVVGDENDDFFKDILTKETLTEGGYEKTIKRAFNEYLDRMKKFIINAAKERKNVDITIEEDKILQAFRNSPYGNKPLSAFVSDESGLVEFAFVYIAKEKKVLIKIPDKMVNYVKTLLSSAQK